MSGLGEQLQHTHDLAISGPMPEGLDMASAGSIPKHLSHLAMQAVADGCTVEQWRAAVARDIAGCTPEVLAEAERFMRANGLWPWPSETPAKTA